MAALFGPKWAYHNREAIPATRLHWYPTAKHAHADGLTGEDGAVSSRIGTWVDGAISYAEAEKEGAPVETVKSVPAVSCAESSKQEGSPLGQKRIYTLQGRERIKIPEQHYQRPLRL